MGKFSEKVTHFFIKKIKKWMFCPVCEDKMRISKDGKVWECSRCGYSLLDYDFKNDYVFWFCDCCGTYLNNQSGFHLGADSHKCTKCGFENNTTSSNIKDMCVDCGKLLPEGAGSLCEDCKTIRLKKAALILTEVGNICNEASKALNTITANSKNSQPYIGTGDKTMRCANCGNEDTNTIWDEGDTVYCSLCCHRTRKEDGEDDLVECPYCHRMRDRKAMYCRHCNDSTWQPSTPEEFKEVDKILKEYGD